MLIPEVNTRQRSRCGLECRIELYKTHPPLQPPLCRWQEKSEWIHSITLSYWPNEQVSQMSFLHKETCSCLDTGAAIWLVSNYNRYDLFSIRLSAATWHIWSLWFVWNVVRLLEQKIFAQLNQMVEILRWFIKIGHPTGPQPYQTEIDTGPVNLAQSMRWDTKKGGDETSLFTCSKQTFFGRHMWPILCLPLNTSEMIYNIVHVLPVEQSVTFKWELSSIYFQTADSLRGCWSLSQRLGPKSEKHPGWMAYPAGF